MNDGSARAAGAAATRVRTGRRGWAWLPVIGVFVLPWVLVEVPAAVYLKIGDIKGGSLQKDHKDWIDVLSFSWPGMSRPSVDFGGGASATELVCHHYVDKSTPDLMRALLEGQVLDKAEIHFTEPVSGAERVILTVEMGRVRVVSQSTGAGSLAPAVGASVGLAFDKLGATIHSYAPDGDPGGTISMTWTLSTGSGGSGTNTPPTISAIGPQTTTEGGSVTAHFTVGDSESPAGALALLRGSSNPLLVPLSGISFGGSGADRSVTVTPAPGQSGTATIVVAVSDGELREEAQFLLTVTEVPDPPVVGAVAVQVTDAGVPLEVAVELSDSDSDLAGIELKAASGNPLLLPEGGIVVGGAGALRTLTLVPVPGAWGEALVTLTAVDDTGTASVPVEFLVLVNPRETAGQFDIVLEPAVVPEGAPAGTPVGRLLVEGGADVPPAVVLVDDDGGRFATGGAAGDELLVGDGPALDFESAPEHRVVARIQDPGSGLPFSKALTVLVTNVNEVPVIGLPPAPAVETGAELPLAGIVVSDVDAGAADVEVAFSVTRGVLTIDDGGALAGRVAGNGGSAVVVTAPLADLAAVLGSGGLAYRSAVDFIGTDTLAISADDGGATGAGGPRSASAGLSIEVFAEGFEAFRIAHFDAGQLLDPATSGPAGNPDRDLLDNLGEYALGGDPWDGTDAGRLVELVWVEDGLGGWCPALRFLRRTAASDPKLQVAVQVATDAVSWGAGPGLTEDFEVRPEIPDFERVTVRSLRSTADEPRQLLRVVVVRDP